MNTTAIDKIIPGPQRAPRGMELSCKSWQTEAALRLLLNNLDAEVAEEPAAEEPAQTGHSMTRTPSTQLWSKVPPGTARAAWCDTP